MSTDQAQLGFESLLSASDADNEKRRQKKECAHLPGTMEEALPFYRDLVEAHHAAMLAGDAEAVQRIRSEAHDLALKLNNYEPGIIADDDAPGCVLDRMTRTADGPFRVKPRARQSLRASFARLAGPAQPAF